jgi:hypothetical protein
MSAAASAECPHTELGIVQLPAGRVSVCNETVFLSMEDLEGGTFEKAFGPFADEDALLVTKTKALQMRTHISRRKGLYTNPLSWNGDDHTSVRMQLNAEGSEAPDAHAVISVEDLPLLTQQPWQARKLADGNYYAFTEMPSPMFMHERLAPQGMVLSEFAENQTLDYRSGRLCFIPGDSSSERDGQTVAPDRLIGNTVRQRTTTSQLPHGRFSQKYKDGATGEEHYLHVKIKGPDEVHRQAARTAMAAKILARGLEPAKTTVRSWASSHQDARRLCTTTSAYQTRNTKWPDKEVDGGMHLGPWLRGRIVKHASTVWCVQTSQGKGHHCATKEEAEQKLLELNSTPHGSINPWRRAADGSRQIMLDEHNSIRVDEKSSILRALADYQWEAEACKLADGTEGYVARNVNQDSKWPYATMLVAWTALPEQDTWPSPRAFIEEIEIQHQNDLRTTAMSIVAFKKTSRQQQIGKQVQAANQKKRKHAAMDAEGAAAAAR